MLPSLGFNGSHDSHGLLGSGHRGRPSIDMSANHLEDEAPIRRMSVSLIPRRYSVTTPYALQPSFATNALRSATPTGATEPPLSLSTSSVNQQVLRPTHEDEHVERSKSSDDEDNGFSRRFGRDETCSESSGQEDDDENLTGERLFDPLLLTLLVVGAEKMTSLAVIPQLKAAGFQVTHSQRGAEALGMVPNGSVDLMLVSSQLPDMDAGTFLEILRNQLCSTVPVIGMSISDSVQIRSKFYAAGAYDMLHLPITTENLTTSVTNVLKSNWYYQKYTDCVKEKKEEQKTLSSQLKKKKKQISKLKDEIHRLNQIIQEKEMYELRLRASESKIKTMKETITRLSFRLAVAEHGHAEWKHAAQLNMTEAEKKIEQLKQKFTNAIETPIQTIMRTISELSQVSFFDREKCRSQLASVMKSLATTDIYAPKIDTLIETVPLDDMTKSWIQSVCSKEPVSCPNIHPSTATTNFFPKVHIPTVSSKMNLGVFQIEETIPRHDDGHTDTETAPPDTITDDISRPSSSSSTSLDESKMDDEGDRNSATDQAHDEEQLGVQYSGPERSLVGRSPRKNMDYKSDDFDIFELVDDELVDAGVNIFVDMGLNSEFRVGLDIVHYFLISVKKRYLPNPYHCFRHAFDVLQTCYQFMRKNPNLCSILTPLNKLSLYIAAICHDIEHPGFNNNFHINMLTPLALLYNDRSVLENHHCACAFNILRDSNANILSNLEPDQFRTVRRQIIDLILCTDMSDHFGLCAKLSTRVGSSTPLKDTNEDQVLLMKILLHAADISNVAKSEEHSQRWGNLIFEEGLRQGDMERKYNVPISPYMDRDNTSQKRMIVSFIDFIVLPLFNSLSQLSPEGMGEYRRNVIHNRRTWSGDELQDTIPDLVIQPGLGSIHQPSENDPTTPSKQRQSSDLHHRIHQQPRISPQALEKLNILKSIGSDAVLDFHPPKLPSHQGSFSGHHMSRAHDVKTPQNPTPHIVRSSPGLSASMSSPPPQAHSARLSTQNAKALAPIKASPGATLSSHSQPPSRSQSPSPMSMRDAQSPSGFNPPHKLVRLKKM